MEWIGRPFGERTRWRYDESMADIRLLLPPSPSDIGRMTVHLTRCPSDDEIGEPFRLLGVAAARKMEERVMEAISRVMPRDLVGACQRVPAAAAETTVGVHASHTVEDLLKRHPQTVCHSPFATDVAQAARTFGYW